MNELNLTPGRREKDWILNVPVTDASEGIVLKEAISDYRYGITKIVVTTTVNNKWIKLKDGDDDLIGPFSLGKDNPLYLEFDTAVYCTIGNALVLQSENDFEFYVLIHGKTGPPIPSKSFNPSPADGATDVSTDAELSWESECESVNYRVFFGTDSNPPLVSTQSEMSYSPSLSADTTYYWRINEFLNGNTVVGDTWTFST